MLYILSPQVQVHFVSKILCVRACHISSFAVCMIWVAVWWKLQLVSLLRKFQFLFLKQLKLIYIYIHMCIYSIRTFFSYWSVYCHSLFFVGLSFFRRIRRDSRKTFPKYWKPWSLRIVFLLLELRANLLISFTLGVTSLSARVTCIYLMWRVYIWCEVCSTWCNSCLRFCN